MKPTEADIKGLLIEGWEVTEADMAASTVYCSRTEHLFRFWYNIKGIGVWNKEQAGPPVADIDFTDFLTGNYDLSAISQHYDPEEWQRIITMCESIVRLITGEQTLEETVRGHLAKITNCQIELVSCNYDKVEFISQSSDKLKTRHLNTVSKDYIYSCGTEYTVQEFKESNCYSSWIEALIPIAEELRSINRKPVSRSTKPSYSDLEQRVEELEKENKTLKDFNKENQKLLDYADTHLGEVDRLGQKIVDLEAQLQDYISPADHEAEMANCDSLLAKVTLERDQARKDSALHLSWFHREYAKNAEASK